jgi:REP element-mobilizing transposase RayT
MSSTHLSLHFHIVFGTKDHAPYLDRKWRGRFHAYLGGAFRAAEAIADEIGGVADHVHCLIGLKATHRLADLMCEIKTNSSR